MTLDRDDADDQTVVAPRSTLQREDHTVVQPRRAARAEGGGEADPAPQNMRIEQAPARLVSGDGLDPERPISPVPGAHPWSEQPRGERGVTQGLPVAYGARAETVARQSLGRDEVHRRLGDAPPQRAVRLAESRETLPSLAKRDRLRRRFTLGAYAATVMLCGLGLWSLASVVFGW